MEEVLEDLAVLMEEYMVGRGREGWRHEPCIAACLSSITHSMDRNAKERLARRSDRTTSAQETA
jgi:hypothetical protein